MKSFSGNTNRALQFISWDGNEERRYIVHSVKSVNYLSLDIYGLSIE